MSEHILSGLSLQNECSILMAAHKRTKVLQEKVDAAKQEFERNEQTIRDCQCKLGLHTRALNKPEIVIVQDLAVYIPIPVASMEEGRVWPTFLRPVGLPME